MIFGIFKSLDQKIKDDQKQLINHLKSINIRSLIVEMDNNAPISKNVIKKQNKYRSFSSEDSISWFANKISKELNAPELKPQLIQLLDDKEFSKYRINTLRCLSQLCTNTNDVALFQFLLSYLEESQNENEIINVLSRLDSIRIPETVNIDYLKHLLVNGSLSKKTAVLKALSHCKHPDLEDLIIQEFKTGNLDLKCSICVTLRSIGTEKSFEVLLSESKRTRSNDLKHFIDSAIKNIKSRDHQKTT